MRSRLDRWNLAETVEQLERAAYILEDAERHAPEDMTDGIAEVLSHMQFIIRSYAKEPRR